MMLTVEERLRLCHQGTAWYGDLIKKQLTELARTVGRAGMLRYFVEFRTRPADLAVKDVKKHFGVEQ